MVEPTRLDNQSLLRKLQNAKEGRTATGRAQETHMANDSLSRFVVIGTSIAYVFHYRY